MYLVEIRRKKGLVDPEANDILHSIHDLKLPVKEIQVSQVYILSGNLSDTDSKKIAEKVLLDPIIETFTITPYKTPEQKKNDPQITGNWDILKLYHHGVTDNIGETALVMMHNMGFKKVTSVMTGKRYIVKGDLTTEAIEKIGSKVLANPIIESLFIRKSR